MTFDGRDVFAPAAALICRGVPMGELGGPVSPSTLVRLAAPVVEHGTTPEGRRTLRVEISWVDHFGNLQLAAMADPAIDSAVDSAGGELIELSAVDATPRSVRGVQVFAELGQGELGLLRDANGHLAIVAGRRSAADMLSLVQGDVVRLTW